MSDWYYAENNEQKGPVPESDLKTQLASHRLPADTLVWKEGMANWTPAAQVAILATTAAPPPLGAATVSSASTVPNPASVTPATTSDIMGPPESLEVDPDDAEKNKIFGIMAYLFILFLVPLFAAKDSPFAKYHANQGLSLFLAEIVIWIGLAIVEGLMYFIVSSGFGPLSFLFLLVKISPFVLIVMGIINAALGKCVPLPIIGGFKLLK